MKATPLADARPDGVRRGHVGRLVVGVDGSESSDQALRWALREADSVGADVLAVLAFGPLGRPGDLDTLTSDDLDQLSAAASALLHSVVARVGQGAEVSTTTVYDEPVAGLLKLLRPTDVLVLGSRGWGRVRRLLLGSVATQCLQQHPGTVVVVRGESVPENPVPENPAARDERPVLVGVDGSQDSIAALRWAAEFAGRQTVSLRIVQAWAWPHSLHPTTRSVVERNREFDRVRAELRTLVRTALAETGRLRELRYAIDVIEESPSAALTSASDGEVQLLVVGRGGPSALRRRALGSTALSCALNAATSVAVVATASSSTDAGSTPEKPTPEEPS